MNFFGFRNAPPPLEIFGKFIHFSEYRLPLQGVSYGHFIFPKFLGKLGVALLGLRDNRFEA